MTTGLLGNAKKVGQGAALTPKSKKVGDMKSSGSLTLGVGKARMASPKSASVGKSAANSTKGSTAMSKNVLSKRNGDSFSTAAGTATPNARATFGKAPKAPKATGVGVNAPTTNWHKRLGFG